MNVLLAFLLCQAGPEIESAELLTGGAFRPGHWSPLKVRIRSKNVVRGEIVIRTDAGFAVVQAVEIGPDVSDPIIPVLALGTDAPLAVAFRAEGKELTCYRQKSLGRGLHQSDRLIRASGVPPDDRTVLFTADDCPLEWLEGVDGVTGRAPAGYRAMGGKEISNLAEVRGKFETRWFEPVDPALCGLAPRDRWTPSKREFALWFVVLYLLAGGGALAAVSRRGARWAGIVAAGLGCVGSVVALAAFPRGSLTVTRRSCDIGEARLDVYFLRSSKSGTVEMEFPFLVKPVWDSYAAAVQDRFERHVDRRRSRIVGLRLEAGESRAFAAVTGEARPRNVDIALKAGDDLDDPPYRYFRSKLMAGADFVYGWTGSRATRGSTVRSADLAEERHPPTLLLRRIP